MERGTRKSGPGDGSRDLALPPCPGPSHWTGVCLLMRVLSWPAHPAPAPTPGPAGLTSDAQTQPWLKASSSQLGLPWPPVQHLGQLLTAVRKAPVYSPDSGPS